MDKPLTAVFIDYEHWFYSLLEQNSRGPDMESLLASIKEKGTLLQIIVFGDFSRDPIRQELARIKQYTHHIIDCENPNKKKDYTDFIMLDQIYQTLFINSQIQQFVLVTGDGHFHSALAHLKIFHDKIVGVYGVKYSFSRQLKNTADWWEEIIPDSTFQYHKLLQLIRNVEKRDIYPTFAKTAQSYCNTHGGSQQDAASALRQLIKLGYIVQEEREGFNGQTVRALIVDWEAVEKDGILERPVW